MIILKSKQLVTSIVVGVVISMSLYADKTRLENDKLIFSNGGGFQNEADVISVLNIGNSGADLSKGVNVVGDYITIDNDIQDLSLSSSLKEVKDRILLGKLADLNLAKFEGNGSLTFPSDAQFVIGDCTKKYIVLSAQKIGAIKVTSPATGPKIHSDDVLYIQKNKAPTYIGNVTDAGETFTPAMSVYGQLVVDGVLANVKRVGINTKDPSETLTVVGDLKVDGKLNASTGIFRPRPSYPTIQSPAVSSEWTTVAYNTIKVKYATHGVFVVGNADLVNMGAVEARISIKQKLSPTATTFEPFTPTADPNQEETSSWVTFVGSWDQWLFSLHPSWTGKLPAFSDNLSTVVDESTLEKEYRIELQVKFDPYWTGVYNKTLLDPITLNPITYTAPACRGAELSILGLPDAPFQKNAEGSVSNATAYTQSSFFSFNPIYDNFLTQNLVCFKTDGFMIDSSSGLNMLYGSGTKFKPFKASKIKANAMYEQQVLKVFSGTRNDSVFKITNPNGSLDWIKDGTWLGFNSPFDLKDVSHNINAIYNDEPVPLWLTQTNIGDGALTMNPDSRDKVDQVGIGGNPTTGVALTVHGNVSFTGQYIGNYGKILVKKVGVATPPNDYKKWATIPKSTISGIQVDKASSVILMATSRFQNYNRSSSDPPLVRVRIKIKDDSQIETKGNVSQFVMSPQCNLNSVFCQMSMDFLPGKTYSAELEMLQEGNIIFGYAHVSQIYDVILLALIIPSVAD